MPLNVSQLEDDLEAFFGNIPNTIEEVADAWANAIDAFVTSAVFPSSTAPAAKTAFRATMLTLTPDTGSTIFISAMATYGTTLLPGIPGLTAPLPFVPPSGSPTADPGPPAADWATAINAWYVSGTLPAGPGNPWS